MGDFDNYGERFLAALYLESEETGGNFSSAKNLHDKYGFKPDKDHWISRMADEWQYSFFKDINKPLRSYGDWSFRLSSEGYRHVEANFLDTDEIREYLRGSPTERPRVLDVAEVELVPAADRLVRLDHNQPDYREAAES